MQIFAKDFTKEWVEYPFNPIALVSTAITKELIFCNAIANVQCERHLKGLKDVGVVGIWATFMCFSAFKMFQI